MAIDPNIKRKADDIRNKVYGREVRESLASGLEAMSSDVLENEGRQSVVEGRQDSVESQWQNVVDETTGKDVISAPEIITARDGEANLRARLDKEHQEVITQLAHTSKQDYTTYKKGLTGIDNINITLEDTEKPIVTFIDDDGRSEVWERLYPVFNSKGVPFTSAVNPGLIGTEGYMTETQIRTLHENGIEIANHSWEHLDYAQVTPVEWEEDMRKGKEWLYNNGYNHEVYVNPYGRGRERRDIMSRHSKVAFGTQGGNYFDNGLELNTFDMGRKGFGSWTGGGYGVHEGAPLEHYKAQVDYALENGTWLVYMTHAWAQPEEQDLILGQLIDYIKSKDIEIVTAGEGFRRKANRIEVGEKVVMNRRGEMYYVFEDVNNHNRTPDTPITEYQNGKITITTLNTTQGRTIFGFSHAGILKTDRLSGINTSDPRYHKQSYELYGGDEIYSRSWTNSGWTEWKQVYPIDYNEELNSRTNEDSPNDFPDLKVTYTLLGRTYMESQNFPTKAACVLVTDKITGNNYAHRQELRQQITSDTWVRSSVSGSLWSEWVKSI